MKTVAMLRRIGHDAHHAPRLYQLPFGARITPGDVVAVDFLPDRDPALAVAASASYDLTDLEEKMIADILNLRTLNNLKRVRTIYSGRTGCQYEDETAEAESDSIFASGSMIAAIDEDEDEEETTEQGEG